MVENCIHTSSCRCFSLSCRRKLIKQKFESRIVRENHRVIMINRNTTIKGLGSCISSRITLLLSLPAVMTMFCASEILSGRQAFGVPRFGFRSLKEFHSGRPRSSTGSRSQNGCPRLCVRLAESMLQRRGALHSLQALRGEEEKILAGARAIAVLQSVISSKLMYELTKACE